MLRRALCSLALLVMLVIGGPAAGQNVVRLSETATVFSGPTEQSTPIETLPAGTKVQAQATTMNDQKWLKVTLPGAFPRVGYLATRSTTFAVASVPTPVIAPTAEALKKNAATVARVPATAPTAPTPIPVVALTPSPSIVFPPVELASAPALGITSTPPVPASDNVTAARVEEPTLKGVHKIFVEKMPNDLDQYINAEITKQLAGRVSVVLKKEDADGILRGTSEAKTGVGAAITGRYLGLHDNATGSISLVDRGESVVIWSGEAGDRNMWAGFMARGGPRKVADRLVHDLKKAIEKAR